MPRLCQVLREDKDDRLQPHPGATVATLPGAPAAVLVPSRHFRMRASARHNSEQKTAGALSCCLTKPREEMGQSVLCLPLWQYLRHKHPCHLINTCLWERERNPSISNSARLTQLRAVLPRRASILQGSVFGFGSESLLKNCSHQPACRGEVECSEIWGIAHRDHTSRLLLLVLSLQSQAGPWCIM